MAQNYSFGNSFSILLFLMERQKKRDQNGIKPLNTVVAGPSIFIPSAR